MRLTLATSIVALAISVAAAPRSGASGQGIGMAIPIAKRSTLLNHDKTVNFDKLDAHIALLKAKIDHGLTNFEQNTGSKHPADLRGSHKRGSAIPLTTDNSGMNWYGSIAIGTPLQFFEVNFDTLFSDTYLPKSTCTSCSDHTLWNPSDSKTAQDLGLAFDITYPGGTHITGERYMDNVYIAGYPAINQTLGAATAYSSNLQSPKFPADGIMGLAFQQISRLGAPSVFETLVSEGGQVPEPAFSLKLTPTGGELHVGGSNSTLYAGDFTYTPVTQKGFWEVEIGSIQGNGGMILTNVDSVIDNGTPLIIGNTAQVSHLYSILGGNPAPSSVGSGYYTFPCDSFPTIYLTFGGRPFPIHPSALKLGTLPSDGTECISNLIGLDMGVSYWVLGGAFLSSVYTKFDVGGLQVGFADLAESDWQDVA